MHLRHDRVSTGYMRVKTAMEWVAALGLLILATPLLVGLAGLIRCTSPGPALYTQVRLGLHGRRFRIYKLRTMGESSERVTGPIWAVVDDPRVTKMGRWLRFTHLDELPQLWNVLRGEMSLIGPRPERPEIAAKIERSLPAFRDRLSVRPGITGLAQMLLPPDADINSVGLKLSCDLEYLRLMSLELDVRIAVATVIGFGGMASSASRRIVEQFAPEISLDAQMAEPSLRLILADYVEPTAVGANTTTNTMKKAA